MNNQRPNLLSKEGEVVVLWRPFPSHHGILEQVPASIWEMLTYITFSGPTNTYGFIRSQLQSSFTEKPLLVLHGRSNLTSLSSLDMIHLSSWHLS